MKKRIVTLSVKGSSKGCNVCVFNSFSFSKRKTHVTGTAFWLLISARTHVPLKSDIQEWKYGHGGRRLTNYPAQSIMREELGHPSQGSDRVRYAGVAGRLPSSHEIGLRNSRSTTGCKQSIRMCDYRISAPPQPQEKMKAPMAPKKSLLNPCSAPLLRCYSNDHFTHRLIVDSTTKRRRSQNCEP